jgi:hypothetical protein
MQPSRIANNISDIATDHAKSDLALWIFKVSGGGEEQCVSAFDFIRPTLNQFSAIVA